MLGKGGGKTVGRGGKEVGGTGPSPCGGDSTHHHREKNSLLRYQKSHWSLTCLVYAHSGIKEALQESIFKSIPVVKTYSDSCGNYLPLGY